MVFAVDAGAEVAEDALPGEEQVAEGGAGRHEGAIAGDEGEDGGPGGDGEGEVEGGEEGVLCSRVSVRGEGDEGVVVSYLG